MALKYKVGNHVKIKDLTWYERNKNKRGNISFPYEVEIVFTPEMSSLCGQIVTISKIGYTQGIGFYRIREDCGIHIWTDEMIEGLVEKETKFGTASNPLEIKSNANCLTQKAKPEFKIGDKITNGKNQLTILHITSNEYIVEDNFGECGTLHFNTQDDWKLVEDKVLKSEPGYYIDLINHIIKLKEGYQFVDENGNIINATKILFEKKKKEYPKTYKECYQITGLLKTSDIYGYKNGLLFEFQKLLICRDAYWKIAGEEMELGKPWEPDYDSGVNKYGIIYMNGVVQKSNPTTNWERHLNKILDFPTEEMRDTFYENFKEEIEFCKELL